MYVICSLVLTLGIAPHQSIVTEDVVGYLRDSSELRYEVDFSTDIRRIIHRDLSLDYKHFMVKRDQCVRL